MTLMCVSAVSLSRIVVSFCICLIWHFWNRKGWKGYFHKSLSLVFSHPLFLGAILISRPVFFFLSYVHSLYLFKTYIGLIAVIGYHSAVTFYIYLLKQTIWLKLSWTSFARIRTWVPDPVSHLSIWIEGKLVCMDFSYTLLITWFI